MTEETREAKSLPSPGVWSFRILLRAAVGAIAGAVVGLCVGLGVGIFGAVALVANAADTGCSTEGFEIAMVFVCAFLGLLQGALAALCGTWSRGLLIGSAISGLFCVWVWMASEDPAADGWLVWALIISLIAGAASGATAGAVGGYVRQGLDKKDQTAKA